MPEVELGLQHLIAVANQVEDLIDRQDLEPPPEIQEAVVALTLKLHDLLEAAK
jgi:hypothetical protein